MNNKNQGELVISPYMNQSGSSWDGDAGYADNNTSTAPLQPTLADPSSTFDLRKSIWSAQSKRKIVPATPALELKKIGQSTVNLQDKPLPSVDGEMFSRRTACSPNCKAYFRGLIIGLLCAGVALAVLLTIWLKTNQRGTTNTYFTSTFSTLTTMSTTSVTTTTITTATTTTASTTTTTTTSTTSTTTSATTSSTTTTTTTSTSSSSTSSTSSSTTSTSSTSTSSTSSTSSTTTSSRTTTTTTSTSSTSSTSSTTTSSTTTTTTTSTSSTSTTSTTTTATTTSTTTSSTSTSTTPWTCISSLTGATTLLHLVNTSSQNYYMLYTYTYVAITTSTRLTLSFRMDSSNWSLDTVLVTTSGTSTNLLANGNFDSGSLSGWTSCNPNNAMNNGLVKFDPLYTNSGSYYWKDGPKDAADYLYQYFNTTVGVNYTISFYLKGDGGITNSADVYIGS